MDQARIRASVVYVAPLTDSILQVVLKPEHYIPYVAGQYLQIMQGETALSYSIANAPLGAHTYELHIRHGLGCTDNPPFLQQIRQIGEVSISLPYGHCHLNQLQKEKPIIFIAAGTGFAPIKAMIEQLLADGISVPFELFWSARSQSDLYMEDKVRQWQAHVTHFNYVSVISSDKKESLVTQVIRRHKETLKQWQIVIGGPFEMVYTTRDALVAHGIQRTALFSDAFYFEQNQGF